MIWALSYYTDICCGLIFCFGLIFLTSLNFSNWVEIFLNQIEIFKPVYFFLSTISSTPTPYPQIPIKREY